MVLGVDGNGFSMASKVRVLSKIRRGSFNVLDHLGKKKKNVFFLYKYNFRDQLMNADLYN